MHFTFSKKKVYQKDVPSQCTSQPPTQPILPPASLRLPTGPQRPMERICHCLGEHRTYHTHTLVYQRQYHRVGGQDGDLGKSPRLKNILTFDQKILFFVQFCYLAPVISFFFRQQDIF